MNNKRADHEFFIFELLIFCFSKFAKSDYFDPKKQFFFCEISLKLHLQKK